MWLYFSLLTVSPMWKIQEGQGTIRCYQNSRPSVWLRLGFCHTQLLVRKWEDQSLTTELESQLISIRVWLQNRHGLTQRWLSLDGAYLTSMPCPFSTCPGMNRWGGSCPFLTSADSEQSLYWHTIWWLTSCALDRTNETVSWLHAWIP